MTKSWIEGTGPQDDGFSLDNLPFGVFSRSGETPRCGTAIGDRILDLAALEQDGLLRVTSQKPVFADATLNAFMALGPTAWADVREQLTSLLSQDGDAALRDHRAKADLLSPQAQATMHLPFAVAGYTDFYAARQHAINAGTLLRGAQNALTPNWLHMPIGYNGRASTVVVSGTPIRRPSGQRRAPDAEAPDFGPCRRLDFELEMGAVLGQGSTHGTPVSVEEADDLIFGYVLLNDWSARDIQAWEAQPLGPFQGKAFGTSISPWVVTRTALDPFRVPGPSAEMPLLSYLREPRAMKYDIDLTVAIRPAGASEPVVVTRSNARNLYYSSAQMVAHHASGGCRMDIGDLLGSGTISGEDRSSWASLLELTWGGRDAIDLAGVERRFLEDGDSVTLGGRASRDGVRIDFGTCEGTILSSF